MDASPLISILVAAGGAIAILATLRWYVSRKSRLEQAGLVKTRLARLHEAQLGAYEKARIYHYLEKVNTGRMTFDEAQQAIATEWIAAYRPMPHNKARTGSNLVDQWNTRQRLPAHFY